MKKVLAIIGLKFGEIGLLWGSLYCFSLIADKYPGSLFMLEEESMHGFWMGGIILFLHVSFIFCVLAIASAVCTGIIMANINLLEWIKERIGR